MLNRSAPRGGARLMWMTSGLLLMGGCSPIEKQAVHLAEANGCCSSLSQAEFRALDGRKEAEFKITESSPTFKFEEGKSYFAAYQLPEGGLARIAVKSTVQDTFIRDTEQVFCPSLIFMDTGKQVIGKQSLDLHYSGMQWFGNPYWAGVAEIPMGARYVVFYTRADAVGRGASVSVSAAHSEIVDSNGQKVKVNVDTIDSRMPCGQIGELSVVFR